MIRICILLKNLARLLTIAAAAVACSQDLAGQIDTYLARQVRVLKIPGLTAAVVRDGNVIYSGAFGVRELGKGEKLTPQHAFHFASVSKTFVAAAIMQLVEKGKLKLDDPPTKFCPYFRLSGNKYHQITIRQMLNHTSGMPDVVDYEWDNPQLDEKAAERYVRDMATLRLLWAPGHGCQYSNMAFDVLGDVIAKASGLSFEEYARLNILEPLGMDQSSFIYFEVDKALRTTGHMANPARASKVYPYNRRHAPSSTLNSSVTQMTRWIVANLNRGELHGHRILEAASYDLLWSPSTHMSPGAFQIGLSWFLSEYKGHRIVFHEGGDTGFRSFLLLLPDDGIGLVLASNWEQTDTGTLARGILDVVLTAVDK
jgi:CubicO group peptidase (beta-lactamase class C family)